MTSANVALGSAAAAEALLSDLYVSLRRSLRKWATVTHQTPQARMGYVGQHLVSVVTGHPGGRSGARGDDLKLPAGKVAEIKCCYRVDQLGKCELCDAAVASIESVCPNPNCGASAEKIIRGDDSKWLLSPRDEKELGELFIPECYYLVLFEFADLNTAGDIDVKIFEVDPKKLGFSLCMIDYFFNIRAKSKSSAPFNLWPDSLKLHLMQPTMIYWSVIREDDTISTVLFPSAIKPASMPMASLADYANTQTLDESAIDAFARSRGVHFSPEIAAINRMRRRKAAKLADLQAVRLAQHWNESNLADDFARIIYGPLVRDFAAWTARYAPTFTQV